MVKALLCAQLFAALATPHDSAVLLVRVLDVSDARIGGDAILITDSADNHARHVLIDASDNGPTVVALLRRFRVDTLAALLLSHPHSDHYGGIADVLAHVPVRTFVYAGTPRTTRGYIALLQRVAALGIPVITADSGVRQLDLVTGGDTITLTLIAPPASCRTLLEAATGQDINNCSLGVRLTRGGFAMLLPGDAEEAETRWWIATVPALLRADVLKAGHHGSSNATDATWIDAVRPRAVLISANGRQHPFAQVLELLARRGVPVYCSADAGTITVRVPRGERWAISTERTGTCHARTVFTAGGPL